MGHRCCSKQKVKRGLWSPEEDEKLARYITTHGHGCWSSIPKLAGLQRCGKSCRLRWINYLRPDLKRGTFTAEEEQIIIDVHRILGNRWAQIAKHLPGRTDNEVKNFWNSCIKKKLISKGLDPKTHNLISSSHHQKHYYSNKTSAARNPSQTQQQSISVFTVDSQDNSIQLVNPLPFVVLPSITPLPPPISQPQVLHQTILMPTSEYQNNNTIWTVEDDRNSHDFINFPCTRSSIGSTGSSSLSCPVVNPSGIGFRDENCNWGTCTVETIGAPGQEQVQPQLLKDSHKEKICGQKIDENGDSKGGRDMDTTPFDSCTFDLEFVESTLFSGAMSHDLTSMDDLTWNF